MRILTVNLVFVLTIRRHHCGSHAKILPGTEILSVTTVINTHFFSNSRGNYIVTIKLDFEDFFQVIKFPVIFGHDKYFRTVFTMGVSV